MAQEMEKFLLEKLSKGLERKVGKGSKIAYSGRLGELETLIDGKLKSSTADDKLIRDKLYSLNNVLTECQTVSKNQIYANILIGNKLKSIKDELENTGGSNSIPQGDTEGSSSDGKNSFLHVPDQSQRDKQDFKEYENEISLLESLVQKESAEQFRAIAVVGSGGIGKTALCRQFFKKQAKKETRNPDTAKMVQKPHKEEKTKKPHKGEETQKLNKEESTQKLNKEEKVNKPNEEEGTQKQDKEDSTQKMLPSSKDLKYCPRIWVDMPRLPDEDKNQKEAVMKSILRNLGVEEETLESPSSAPDLNGMVSLLHQQLWGKKYLIILDSVRGNEKWYYDLGSCLVPGKNWGDRLAYGFPKGYGGAVIVTSRNEELAMRMVGEENLHRMMPASYDEVCWSVFRGSAQEGLSQFDFPNEGQLKAEVCRKCAGIPLAAKVMGQIVNKQLQEESAKGANPQ
ncbi:uncharacterized protein LOC115739801 [Rhodamnia argentea]|uniref:Uncharacterized protein LOC115739801 n=1 Tax=Rhodamnia argentea TaxID=178133 RepID=A0A8B8P271_9MYRT|nr:uncharacterized protein LOC115739801 [Rhodamnia argentea]